MLFLLVPLHNLTDLNRLLSNNIATALFSLIDLTKLNNGFSPKFF